MLPTGHHHTTPHHGLHLHHPPTTMTHHCSYWNLLVSIPDGGTVRGTDGRTDKVDYRDDEVYLKTTQKYMHKIVQQMYDTTVLHTHNKVSSPRNLQITA